MATDTVTRVPLGRLPLVAMLLAPLPVALAFQPHQWYAAALGLLGVGLLAGAALTAHRLRSSFPDEIVERRTVAVVLGDTGSRVLYLALVAGGYVTLAGLTLLVPWTAIAMLTALLTAVPAWQVVSGAVDRMLDPVVRDTALVTLYYGALVGLGSVL